MQPTPPPLELTRARTICLGVLIAQGIYTYVTLLAIPSLIGTDPVLLELLRGSTVALVAGGAFARVGRASLALALLAPFPTLMMSDPFVFWAGRLWGPGIVEFVTGRSPRSRRRVARAIRFVERWRSWAIVFAYVIPLPSVVVYAAAGWTGMSLRRFLLLDLLGTAIWIGGFVGLGYALGHPAVHVAHDISHYSLYVTIGLVALIVVWSALRGPRGLPETDAGEPRDDAG